MTTSMVNIQYLEHESSNAYRNYPFSETSVTVDTDGAAFATDIFVDAILHPIVSEKTSVYLSEADFATGRMTAVCGTGEAMEGVEESGAVELYDSRGRHAGTLVCGSGWEREKASGRTRRFEGLEFAAAVCCPVVHNGVFSINDEDRTMRTTRRNIVFQGDGCVNPVVRRDGEGRYWVRFDVQYDQAMARRANPVRQVTFAVVGHTLFDLVTQSGNTVLAAMPLVDREDVCWQAHKEDAIVNVVDTCEDSSEACVTPTISYKSDEVVVCATDFGAVNIVADDVVGYKNALLVTTIEGEMRPITPKFDSDMTQDDIIDEGTRLMKRPVQSGNGIRISVAGLSNGR